MRGYWSGLFMGALVGAAATAFYNRQQFRPAARQIKARYKRTVDIIDDTAKELSALVGEQES